MSIIISTFASMLQKAERRRAELYAIGATCDNCKYLNHQQPHGKHCYTFKERPIVNVCYGWERSIASGGEIQTDASTGK